MEYTNTPELDQGRKNDMEKEEEKKE